MKNMFLKALICPFTNAQIVKGQIIWQLTNNLSFCQFPTPDHFYENPGSEQRQKHSVTTHPIAIFSSNYKLKRTVKEKKDVNVISKCLCNH